MHRAFFNTPYHCYTTDNTPHPSAFSPCVSQVYPDPDEQLQELMDIWRFPAAWDPTSEYAGFQALPKEILYSIFAPILRESYLKSLGAPVREVNRNGTTVLTREYSIADYIREKGQPKQFSGTINLSQRGLTSLNGIAMIADNPTTLNRINLSNNLLSNYVRSDIPLVGDQIHPQPFSIFKNIKELNLNKNLYYTLPETFFQGLSSLQQLKLESNRLKDLPQNIFQGLSSLEYLYLENNQLQTLPQNIFQGLSSLKHLYLENNQLQELHENIFRGLSSLRQLKLEGNQLKDLPQNIFQDLSSLQDLYLSGNQLQELHENIFRGLSSLLRLSLYYNYISGTENEFKQSHYLPPSLDPKSFIFYPQHSPATQGRCYPCGY